MFRTPSTTDQAKDAVAAGAQKATDGAQVAVDKAADLSGLPPGATFVAGPGNAGDSASRRRM